MERTKTAVFKRKTSQMNNFANCCTLKYNNRSSFLYRNLTESTFKTQSPIQKFYASSYKSIRAIKLEIVEIVKWLKSSNSPHIVGVVLGAVALSAIAEVLHPSVVIVRVFTRTPIVFRGKNAQ